MWVLKIAGWFKVGSDGFGGGYSAEVAGGCRGEHNQQGPSLSGPGHTAAAATGTVLNG